MNGKFRPAQRFYTILGMGVLSLSVLFAGNTAFAAGPHDRSDWKSDHHQVQQQNIKNGKGDHHQVRPQERPVIRLSDARYHESDARFHNHHELSLHNRIVRSLPARHVPVWVGGTSYFFSSGIFYRQDASGYLMVGPPIGAVVSEIPVSRSTVLVNGATYYYVDGTYYQRTPSGYVVVADPTSAAATPVAANEQVTVTAQLLNVRSGPGLENDVIGQVRQGDILTVNGTSPGWLYVELPDGTFGWVQQVNIASSAVQAVG